MTQGACIDPAIPYYCSLYEESNASDKRCSYSHENWWFRHTRTTFTNALVRFVAWNMPYHVEHHVHPTVPFHKLPAFHKILRDDLTVTAKGYPAAAKAVVSAALRGEA